MFNIRIDMQLETSKDMSRDEFAEDIENRILDAIDPDDYDIISFHVDFPLV